MEAYYPSGGWEDLFGQFDTLPNALYKARLASGDWFHIVDTTTGMMIYNDTIERLRENYAKSCEGES